MNLAFLPPSPFSSSKELRWILDPHQVIGYNKQITSGHGNAGT